MARARSRWGYGGSFRNTGPHTAPGDIHVGITLLLHKPIASQASLEKARAVLASLPGITLLVREILRRPPGRVRRSATRTHQLSHIVGNVVSLIVDDEENQSLLENLSSAIPRCRTDAGHAFSLLC